MKNEGNFKRQILAIIIVFTMLCSIVPTTAFAEDDDAINLYAKNDLTIPEGDCGSDIEPVNIAAIIAGGTEPYTYSFEESSSNWLVIEDSNIIGTRPDTKQNEMTVTIVVKDSSDPVQSCSVLVHVGAVGAHNWDDGVITKNPTCTETGEKTYTCTDEGCGATKIVQMESTGHKIDWSSKTIVKEANCMENGQQVYNCPLCGEIVYASVIDALGHNYDNNGICQRCGYTASVEHITGTYHPVKITLDKDHPTYSFCYDINGLPDYIYVRTSQETTAAAYNPHLLYVKNNAYSYNNAVSAFWANERSYFDICGAFYKFSSVYKTGNIITVSIDPNLIGDQKVVVVVGLRDSYSHKSWEFVDKDGNHIDGYSSKDSSAYYAEFPEDPSGYIDEYGNTWAFTGWYDQYGVQTYKYYSYLNMIYDDLTIHPEFTEGCTVSFIDKDGTSNLGSFIVIKGSELNGYDSRVNNIKVNPASNELFDKWVDKDGNEIGTFEITGDTTFYAVYKEITVEKTQFHKVTSMDDFVKGAHYIFTYAGEITSGAKIALTYDEEEKFSEIIAVDSNEEQILIPLDDKCVFTATMIDIDTDDNTANCKFKAVNGSFMKLGTDSTTLTPLFSDKAGTISVSFNEYYKCYSANNGGRYLIYNRLNLSFAAARSWNYQHNTESSKIEVWTDAVVQPQEETTYWLSQWIDFTVEGNTDVIVYKASDGKNYMLTVDGAKEITVGKGKTVKNTEVSIVNTNRSNSWNSQWVDWKTDVNYEWDTLKLMQDNQYLCPGSDGIFSSKSSDVLVYYDLSGWSYAVDKDDKSKVIVTIGSADGKYFIGWDDDKKQFISVDQPDQAAHLFIYDEDLDDYIRLSIFETIYTKITNLNDLDDATQFLIILTSTDNNGNTVRRALQSKSPYLSEVVIGEDGIIKVSDTENSGLLKVGEFEHGDLEGSGNGYRKYSCLKTLKGDYYNPGKFKAYNYDLNYLFYKIEGIRIEEENGIFYLRGNNSERWLGYDYSSGNLTMVEADGNKVKIEIYAAQTTATKSVTYNGLSNNNVVYTNKYFTLKTMPDVYVIDGKEVTSETEGAVLYSFLGWSIVKPETSSDEGNDSYARYLSIEESSNIYNYDSALEMGTVSSNLKDKYQLVGNCNPDKTDTEDINDFTLEDNNLNLYPVYAVRGYDAAAASVDNDGNKIISVSDWKTQELEDEGKYDNYEKEKWLGYINVEVYLDGEKYGSTEKVYFKYHNDNATDLNLKFVSNEILNSNKYDGDLYAYTSDQTEYPEETQVGNYKIEGVYAVQGASEDGLTCKYNWITSCGGQLDNVKGGSTVKIYLTSFYQVEYYFDSDGDGIYEKLDEGEWSNDNLYCTPGTENAFESIEESADYLVTSDNENKDLMNKVDDYDNWFFIGKKAETDTDNSDSKRTIYKSFAYRIADWSHKIPISSLPTAAENYMLTSDNWSLNDANGSSYENINPSSNFDVCGGAYTSEAVKGSNTHETFMDDDDTTHTYHLYISAKKLDNQSIYGNLTVSKTVTGNTGDKEKEFSFQVVLSNTEINGIYGDMIFVNGISSFTLKDGESKTATNLLEGVTYTVTEDDYSQEGYSTTKTGETGTIIGNETATASFINSRSNIPKTSDSSLLGILCVVIGLSGIGIGSSLLNEKHKKSEDKDN